MPPAPAGLQCTSIAAHRPRLLGLAFTLTHDSYYAYHLLSFAVLGNAAYRLPSPPILWIPVLSKASSHHRQLVEPSWICVTRLRPLGPPMAPLRTSPGNSTPMTADVVRMCHRDAARDDAPRLLPRPPPHRGWLQSSLDYIFLTVGRVGSSTNLIAQRVEFFLEADKRSYLMDFIHAQKANAGKVIQLAVHWIQQWSLLLPGDQREYMEDGCNRLLKVTQDFYFQATGWRHASRLHNR